MKISLPLLVLAAWLCCCCRCLAASAATEAVVVAAAVAATPSAKSDTTKQNAVAAPASAPTEDEILVEVARYWESHSLLDLQSEAIAQAELSLKSQNSVITQAIARGVLKADKVPPENKALAQKLKNLRAQNTLAKQIHAKSKKVLLCALAARCATMQNRDHCDQLKRISDALGENEIDLAFCDEHDASQQRIAAPQSDTTKES